MILSRKTRVRIEKTKRAVEAITVSICLLAVAFELIVYGVRAYDQLFLTYSTVDVFITDTTERYENGCVLDMHIPDLTIKISIDCDNKNYFLNQKKIQMTKTRLHKKILFQFLPDPHNIPDNIY